QTDVGQALLNRRRGRGGATTGPSTGPTTEPATRPGGGRFSPNPFLSRLLAFVTDEGAAVVVSPSTQGDGGTIFVAAASIPNEPVRGAPVEPGVEPTTAPTSGPSTGPATRPRVWSKGAPKIPAQVTLAA